MAAFTFYFGLHSSFSMSYFSSSSLGGGDHDNPYVLGGGGGGGGKFVSSLLFTAVLALSLLSLLFVIISFFLLKKKRLHEAQTFDVTRQDPPQVVHESDESRRDDPTQLSHSLLLDLLPPDSEPGPGTTQKKKKKRARKKNKKSDDARRAEEEREDEVEGERSDSGRPSSDSDSRAKPELICLYPFTSSSSATQRRIKQHYDELVKCHESKGLTLAQVSQFVNCLVEARSELQHKSEVIQRRFTITKALLFKADRSSFDRLRQQIYKLELEQKRLEEDAFVYNWLQQQLKLSPAYKKMLELSTSMELKAKSGELVEAEDSDVPEISFEELLAQEKKDSFWQKTRKSRCCSN